MAMGGIWSRPIMIWPDTSSAQATISETRAMPTTPSARARAVSLTRTVPPITRKRDALLGRDSLQGEQHRPVAVGAAGDGRAGPGAGEVAAAAERQHVLLKVGPGPTAEALGHVRPRGDEHLTLREALAHRPDGVGIP